MDAFIETLLSRLLATSVQTALLTAVVWALCRHMPRLSPAAQCWLWWLVALQALCGLVANPIELPWLTPAAALPQIAPVLDMRAVPVGATALLPAVDYAPAWPKVMLLFWAGGLMVMGGFALRGWRRGRILLQHSSPCTDEHLLRTLATIAQLGGLRTAPPLRLSQRIDSPMLIGHLRPKLLLPTSRSLSNEELEMALTHELAHLQRGDLWWGWVPTLARQLFFFHPLVHFAAREYSIAREAACDAAVVDTGHRSRRDYGRLLLRLGTSAESRTGLAAASPTFQVLKRRLTMLQNTSFLSRAGALALLAVVAAVGVMPLRLVAAPAPVPAQVQQPTPSVSQAEENPATTARRYMEATDAREILKRQLEELQARLATAKLRAADEMKMKHGVQVDTASREAIVRALERRPTEQARAQLEQQSQAAALTYAALINATTDRRLRPESRPMYQSLFDQYTADCRAKAEQSPAFARNDPMQRANCLEQAELRAYKEAQATEKEALVEQRRREAMGLSAPESPR